MAHSGAVMLKTLDQVSERGETAAEEVFEAYTIKSLELIWVRLPIRPDVGEICVRAKREAILEEE